MQTVFVEATQPAPACLNWGKFMVARFTHEEWQRQSQIDIGPGSLLRKVGWSSYHVLVFDLQTGEGGIFLPGGLAQYDLNEKHKIWVCPMFEPFLVWLYQQDLSDISRLPAKVELQAEFQLYGYRRAGGDVQK